jgi:hypothetical protein
MLDSTNIFGEEFGYMKRTQRQYVPELSDADTPYYDPDDWFSTLSGNLYFRHFNTLWIHEPDRRYQKCPHCGTLKTGSGCIGCGFDFRIFEKEIGRYDYLIGQGFEEAIKLGKLTRDEYHRYKYYAEPQIVKKIRETIYSEIDLKATKQVLQERWQKIGKANVTAATFGVTEEQYQKQRLLNFKTNIGQHIKGPFEEMFENFPIQFLWIVPVGIFSAFCNGGIGVMVLLIGFSIYGMHRYKVIQVTKHLEDLKQNDVLNKYMKKKEE